MDDSTPVYATDRAYKAAIVVGTLLGAAVGLVAGLTTSSIAVLTTLAGGIVGFTLGVILAEARDRVQ